MPSRLASVSEGFWLRGVSRAATLAAQLLLDVERHVDRDRERQAHEAAGAAVDLRIDADHFAAHVEQRPARVAGVDGDVGLDEGDEVLLWQRAPLGADDAGGRGGLPSGRVSAARHPLCVLQPTPRARSPCWTAAP